MMNDDKVSNDLCLLPDLNVDSSIPPFNSIEFESSICDLINLEEEANTPNLIPEHNPFFDEPQEVKSPIVVNNHQDMFSLDSQIEDAKLDSPRGIQDMDLSCLRVPAGSPRGLLHSRSSGSPRFGSPKSPVLIDTTAPFESVKDAVSMFGGITDWKAHKIQNIERKKTVDQALEKIQEDIPEYNKQAVAAEEAKQQVMMELERTKSIIEELKLELEKAEKEEQQAKQDAGLAKLRVEEMEKGIATESSVASKAQLDVAKARYLSAASELGTIREEIQMVSNEYESLLREKDLATKKAENSVSEAKDVEKEMEGMMIEVMSTKELLELAKAAHLEAEEKKFAAAMARDQDVYNQEKELKMVEDEIEKLRQHLDSEEDMKTKLKTASARRQDLKAELAAYNDSNMDRINNSNIQEAMGSARKELEEVKANIEKAKSEVKTLKIIVGSLQSELEREKKDLSETKERNRKHVKEEKCVEIAKKLQEACREAEEAKTLALAAQEEVRKAQEESDVAKTGVSAIEKQLTEAKKEMETARASEKLALAAIKALQETEYTNKIEDMISTPRSKIISVEEYYELSRQAHEVEEAANRKLAEIVSKIEEAKEEESKILENLEEVSRETTIRKVELREAMTKVEKARDGKIGMEHELRKWRSDNGQRSPEGGNKNLGKSKSAVQEPTTFGLDEEEEEEEEESSSSSVTIETKKKKKRFSMLPKVFMFLSRKKSHK